MSQGSAVRAGRAFVEIGANTAPLETSLAGLPSLMQGLAAQVATTTALSTALTTASAAKSATAVQGVSATMGGLTTATMATGKTQSLVGAIASKIWGGVTGNVVGMTVAIGAASVATRALGLQGTIAGKALEWGKKNPLKVGLAGMVTSIAGAVTGSSRLSAIGTQIGRGSIGLSIVNGLETGGWRGGLKAAIRNGVSYATVQGVAGSIGLARKTLVGAVTLPKTALSGALSGFSAIQSGIAGLLPGMGKAKAAADATSAALKQGGGVGAAVAGQLRGYTGAIGGLWAIARNGAAAFVATSIGSALKFAGVAESIKKKAKETGQSIGSLTDKEYGTNLAGTLISESDINNASLLKESMTTLGAVVSVAWAQVGAAVAPALTWIVQGTTAVVQGGAVWLNQNREMIVTGLKVAGAITGVAAAVGAVYGGFLVLGPAVALVLNPFTLLTAAVVAGTAYWATYSEEGHASLGVVAETATQISGTMGTAITGIVDALSAGDLSLAAEIGMDGVKAVFVEVSGAVQEIWTNVTSSMANWLVDSGFMASINTAISHIENGFTRLKEWFMGWVISFQELVGIVSAERAKAMKEENTATANATVETRTRQMTAENNQFRNNPSQVKEEIKREKDLRIEAIRAEREAQRAAAQEKLAESVNEATAARKKKEAELAAAAQARSSPAYVTQVTRAVSANVQFGAAGADRQGAGGVWKKIEDLTKKVADNTARMADGLDAATALAT
jgi:hypothetical protein